MEQHQQQIDAAWQTGYFDAYFDGMDLSDLLVCQCPKCLAAYAKGQDAALKEIFESRGVINAA